MVSRCRRTVVAQTGAVCVCFCLHPSRDMSPSRLVVVVVVFVPAQRRKSGPLLFLAYIRRHFGDIDRRPSYFGAIPETTWPLRHSRHLPSLPIRPHSWVRRSWLGRLISSVCCYSQHLKHLLELYELSVLDAYWRLRLTEGDSSRRNLLLYSVLQPVNVR